MIPQLLITKDRKQAKMHIDQLIKQLGVPSYNVFTVEKVDSSISIDQIREVSTLFTRSSPEPRLIAIFDFETAKTEAQNAFLKTLEEKGDSAQFVLVVSNEGQLLDTIVSRCKKVVLQKKQSQKSDIESIILESHLFDNLKKYTLTERDKTKALAICDKLLEEVSQQLLDTPHLSSVISKLIELRSLIDKNNVNPQAAIDQFFIEVDRINKKSREG